LARSARDEAYRTSSGVKISKINGVRFPGGEATKQTSTLSFREVEGDDAAKARLDAKRAKRRERHARNNDQLNAKRREKYIP
jgi:hypothetical protein